ncbi:hypothetical protein D9M71_719320 [compost metagenome]
MQGLAEQPGEAGHDDELGEHADQHPQRAPGDFGEVFELEGQAHAEHDQTEQRHDPFGQRQEPGGLVERQHGEQQDPQGKGVADEAAEGGEGTHGHSSSLS